MIRFNSFFLPKLPILKKKGKKVFEMGAFPPHLCSQAFHGEARYHVHMFVVQHPVHTPQFLYPFS